MTESIYLTEEQKAQLKAQEEARVRELYQKIDEMLAVEGFALTARLVEAQEGVYVAIPLIGKKTEEQEEGGKATADEPAPTEPQESAEVTPEVAAEK